jgi:hypothetical protein
VDPKYSSFASATSSILTIRGHTIHIDGRGLSHDLLPISLLGYTGGFLSRASVNQLTLIPAVGYTFQPGSGIVADMTYTVGLDGTVSFPASCSGFLGGSGTDTLIVGGYPVLVDATLADSDLLSIVNAVGVVAEARRYLFAILVPAEGYAPQTAHGILHGFGIQRDGSVNFDGSITGHYVLTTIPRLERSAAPHRSRFAHGCSCEWEAGTCSVLCSSLPPLSDRAPLCRALTPHCQLQSEHNAGFNLLF